MRIATIGTDPVDVEKGAIAAIVALLGAVLPVVNAITTAVIDRYTEENKVVVEERTAEAATQATELQRLHLALSAADPNDRRRSLQLLLNAGLLRDPKGKLASATAEELPRWPPSAESRAQPN